MPSPQESEKKVRKLAQKDPAPGKELEMLQEGQVELQNIQAQQQALLQEEMMSSKAGDQQLQQMASVGEMGLLSAEGEGESQPPVMQQVGQMNPETQATLGKYGLKQGQPKTQQSQARSVKVTPNKIVVNNTTYTTTHNDVKVSQPSMGMPVIRQPQVQRKDGGGGNSAITKFKTWMSNAFARQREENAIREKEYKRKDWSLSRSASRMMRGLEKLGKTIGERLDPRKLNTSKISSLQMLSWLMTIGTVAKFWPQIIDMVGKAVVWLKKVGEYFGITGHGGKLKWEWKKSKMREGILNLLGARGGEDIPTALRKFFWNPDKNDGQGIFNYFVDKLKDWFSELGDRISSIEVPTFSKTGNEIIDSILSGLTGFMNFGKDVLVAMFTDKKFSTLRAGRTIDSEVLENLTQKGPVYSGHTNHLPAGAKHKNAVFFDDNLNEDIYVNENGEVKKKSGKGYGDKAVLEHYGAKRPDALIQTDIFNGRLTDSYGASARMSSAMVSSVNDPNDISTFITGMGLLEKQAEKSPDEGVLVVSEFITALENTFGIKKDDYFGQKSIKYALFPQDGRKYDYVSEHGLIGGAWEGLKDIFTPGKAVNTGQAEWAWNAVPASYDGPEVETDSSGNPKLYTKYYITYDNLKKLSQAIFDKVGLASNEGHDWTNQNIDLRARLRKYLYSTSPVYKASNLDTAKLRTFLSSNRDVEEAYFKDKYGVDTVPRWEEGQLSEYKMYYPGDLTGAGFQSRIGTVNEERLYRDHALATPFTKPGSGLTYTYTNPALGSIDGSSNAFRSGNGFIYSERDQYSDYLMNTGISPGSDTITLPTGKTVDISSYRNSSDGNNAVDLSDYTINQIDSTISNKSEAEQVAMGQERAKLQEERSSGTVVPYSGTSTPSASWENTRASQSSLGGSGSINGTNLTISDFGGISVAGLRGLLFSEGWSGSVTGKRGQFGTSVKPVKSGRAGSYMYGPGIKMETNNPTLKKAGLREVSSSDTLDSDTVTANFAALLKHHADQLKDLGVTPDTWGQNVYDALFYLHWLLPNGAIATIKEMKKGRGYEEVMRDETLDLGWHKRKGWINQFYAESSDWGRAKDMLEDYIAIGTGKPKNGGGDRYRGYKGEGISNELNTYLNNITNGKTTASTSSSSASVSGSSVDDDDDDDDDISTSSESSGGGFLSSGFLGELSSYITGIFDNLGKGFDYLVDLDAASRQQKEEWKEVTNPEEVIKKYSEESGKDLKSMIGLGAKGNIAKELTSLDPEHTYNIKYSDSEPGKFTLYYKDKKGPVPAGLEEETQEDLLTEDKEHVDISEEGVSEGDDRSWSDIDSDDFKKLYIDHLTDQGYDAEEASDLFSYQNKTPEELAAELTKLDSEYDYKSYVNQEGNTRFARSKKQPQINTDLELDFKDDEGNSIDYADSKIDVEGEEENEWSFLDNESLREIISGILRTDIPDDDKRKLLEGSAKDKALVLSKYDSAYDYSYEFVNESGKNKVYVKRKPKPPQESVSLMELRDELNQEMAQGLAGALGIKLPDKITDTGDGVMGLDNPSGASLAENILEGSSTEKLEDVTKAGFMSMSNGLGTVRIKLGDFLEYAATTGNTYITQTVTKTGDSVIQPPMTT